MQPNLFIDGYNLMHAAGLARANYGPGDLERARDRFLAELSHLLDDRQRARTVVVFDAKNSVGFFGSEMSAHGMKVVYPDRGTEADTVIEQLIRQHSAPRGLSVVSSDHRIQVAAKRRRAKPVDSEVFLERRRRASEQRRGPEKPTESAVSDAEVDFWTAELGDLLRD